MDKRINTVIKKNSTENNSELVMLVGVMFSQNFQGSNVTRQYNFKNTIDEAVELVNASGAKVVDIQTTNRDKPHTALFIGTGKAQELAWQVKEKNINLVVFNHELSPIQERNLEKMLNCRVLDRVGLILAIFAKRAKSQEGKIQVELAQLSHLSSRLVRGYGHLQSQRGGVGLKGPGETQLETDRRLINLRINSLKRQLNLIERQRKTQRKSRLKNGIKSFALVGYTNSGKSSLFNRLSKADTLVENQLFATLDTTVRRLYLSNKVSVLLVDTVGFISDLPHKLIKAFSATLDETIQADVLLHVVDISDKNYENKIEEVNRILFELNAHEIVHIMVYNKIDLINKEAQYPGLISDFSNNELGVRISVKESLGLEDLRTVIFSQV